MMLRKLDWDEEYPVFCLDVPKEGDHTLVLPSNKRGVIDVPEDLVERYEKAEREWREVQEAISDLVGWPDRY